MAKVLCIGDSVTYGYLLNEKDSFPSNLQRLLKNEYIVMNSSTVGISATDYLYMDLFEKGKDWNPDIVIILFGLNDSNMNSFRSVSHFKTSYQKLIHSYHSKIYLCTPTYPYLENYGICFYNLEKIIPCIHETGKEEGLKVIDLYSYTSHHREWFFNDGVHPNVLGQKQIAQKLFEEIF